MGARITELNAKPDGRNINEGCGAMHTGPLRRAVRRLGADAGVAFDGDADRLQLVDEKGRLLDGDVVLAALAPRLAARRRLPQRTVVGTLMTNAALEAHLASHGIELVRTPVGDRHIVASMTEHGYGLGGEPSGHLLIPRRGLLTGDGLVAAIACLRILAEERIAASELAGGYRAWPLEIVSFRVRRKTQISRLKLSSRVIREIAERFAGRARIVVRYSGTEPKVRVMVEARRRRDVNDAMAPIVDALREEVGA
jgi:phosphoglucosamine mutase